jgi:hypothetical protein
MKTAFNRFAVLALMAGLALVTAQVQAGPSIKDLTETNLADSSSAPFHLNTDRYKNAYQTISSFVAAHDELSASSILIADNHGHFLHGVVSDWTYYTYGAHKGIELYVFNPEDGSQFLTVEVFLPKEQQRNMDKRDSYLTSFQQIENFLTGSTKYRLDLVFQDDVRIEWGKGYEFKLDDEGIELSFTVMNAAHPKAKVREVVKDSMKTKSSMTSSATPSATMVATAQATVSSTTTPTTSKKKKSSKTSSQAVVATPTVSDDSK